ncbi:MAG: hypothetical protein N2235_05290 [Fischerella sp.]|nr:hypothetical protein [Fischerella sp.]
MTVFVVDIEAVETRYTGQWKTHVPSLLSAQNLNVALIEGCKDIPSATTPGAFLNFGGTNVYKARQIEKMGRLFCSGYVRAGDQFLFTDAWHPGIINLRYMSELLNIPVKIHALWHAGSYDPADFLGRLIGDAPWVRHAEKSFFHAIDHNYFATEFHINLFCKNLLGCEPKDITTSNPGKIIRTGWPMEYLQSILAPYKTKFQKTDTIIFPHRIAPEKQVEIFRDLARELPEYKWVVCQDRTLNKKEYHELLAQSKIVFSASLQETLGIGCYEGALVGALPLVPDRLSYSEMYNDNYKYPSEWTADWEHYKEFKLHLISRIRSMISNYDSWSKILPVNTEELTKKFFSADQLIKNLM